MKKILVLFSLILAISCKPKKTEFSSKALNDSFISLDNQKIPFQKILEKHKGKTILIDVWASWCGDCIKGMPKVVALQEEFPETVYLFLSLDKTFDDWKLGIKKHNVKGDHYLMTSGWKGDFGTFLNLNWIPRYLVINKEGKIAVFNKVHADDKAIKKALSN